MNKKNFRTILYGSAVIAVGIFLILKAFGLELEILFKGWWTLFIFIPSVADLVFDRGRQRVEALFGILLATLLLLAAQEIITWGMFWRLLLAIFLIAIGISAFVGIGKRKGKDE